MLTKDTILNANDTPLSPIEVSEWACMVYVPVLSLADLEQLSKASKDTNANAAMAVQIIRDENGARIFNDGDAKALANKSGRVILKVLKKFNEVNGLQDDAVEQAAKN